MSTGLHKEARAYCPETCPDVDGAFSEAETGIRKLLDELCAEVKLVGTEKLREALCQAISDKNDIEQERDELADRVKDLEAEVDSLCRQIDEMKRELSEASE